MKLIATRRQSQPTDRLIDALNTGVGTSLRFVPDDEAQSFIDEHTRRGFICHEFDYTGSYSTQTTIVKTTIEA